MKPCSTLQIVLMGKYTQSFLSDWCFKAVRESSPRPKKQRMDMKLMKIISSNILMHLK